MALGVPHMAADLALGEDGVAGDERAFERQSLEERQRRRDLVGLGRFERDVPAPRLAAGVAPERRHEGLRVETLEEVVIGGVAGRAPALDSKQPQRFRPQPATPAPDRYGWRREMVE